MKKLKNKIFCVIFLILTLFLISILVIFNSQIYRQELESVINNLMRMDRNREGNRPPELEGQIPDDVNNQRRIFMDSTIYTVEVDNDFNIIDVTNHTPKYLMSGNYIETK